MGKQELASTTPTGAGATPPPLPAEVARHEFAATLPIPADGFLSFEQILPRLPVGARLAREWTRTGIIPSIRLPGSRRVLFHWPSVESALLRRQRGGDV